MDFYATLGNHDDPSQRFYKPFNMAGKRYYSFRMPIRARSCTVAAFVIAAISFGTRPSTTLGAS